MRMQCWNKTTQKLTRFIDKFAHKNRKYMCLQKVYVLYFHKKSKVIYHKKSQGNFNKNITSHILINSHKHYK